MIVGHTVNREILNNVVQDERYLEGVVDERNKIFNEDFVWHLDEQG